MRLHLQPHLQLHKPERDPSRMLSHALDTGGQEVGVQDELPQECPRFMHVLRKRLPSPPPRGGEGGGRP